MLVYNVAFDNIIIDIYSGDTNESILQGNVTLTGISPAGAPVPEPGTMMLLGTGLFSLIGFRKRS